MSCCSRESTWYLAIPSICIHQAGCCRTQTLASQGTGHRHSVGYQKHSNLRHQGLVEQGRHMQAPERPDRSTWLDPRFRMHSHHHHMACMHSMGYHVCTSLLVEVQVGLEVLEGQEHHMPAPLPLSRNTGWGHHCHTHSLGHCKARRNSWGWLSCTSLLVLEALEALEDLEALEVLGCRLAPQPSGRNTCQGHRCHMHSHRHCMVCMRFEYCHACTSWWLELEGWEVQEVEVVAELGLVRNSRPKSLSSKKTMRHLRNPSLTRNVHNDLKERYSNTICRLQLHQALR